MKAELKNDNLQSFDTGLAIIQPGHPVLGGPRANLMCLWYAHHHHRVAAARVCVCVRVCVLRAAILPVKCGVVDFNCCGGSVFHTPWHRDVERTLGLQNSGSSLFCASGRILGFVSG